MERYFNVAGACDASIHYMVDLQSRLEKIKKMIDRGAYFTINRARQYGKTTILNALQGYLQKEYTIVSMDFQFLSHASFESEGAFVRAFSRELLNMELILEKYVMHFHDLYGDRPDTFKEEDGRRYFLLYLRPIINGTGNYYIEAETRNMERTDVIIDYRGEQFVVELKIWRGNAYHERGEKQISEYLEYYHLEKGYMLSYNFNKKKEIGVKHRKVGNKVLVEAVV